MSSTSRVTLQNVNLAAAAATKDADFQELKPHLATEADANAVMDFLLRDFLLNEPHCAAIGLQATDAKAVFGGCHCYLLENARLAQYLYN